MSIDLHINWELFHFLRPQLLWLILPLVIISGLAFFQIRTSYKWVQFFNPAFRKQFVLPGNENSKIWMQLLVLITAVCAIVGLAGPTWQTIEIPGKKLQNPVVLVLDVSQSMMASDLSPNRLTRAKFKVQDFLDLNPRAQVGLVVFAGSAHMVIPPTNDFNILTAQLENIKPTTMPVAGSDVAAGIKLALQLCEATEAPGHIIAFTDELGESLWNSAQQIAQNTQTKLFVVPMATKQGAAIPRPSRGYFTQQGNRVVSKLDSAEIKKLQGIQSVQVVSFAIDSSDVTTIYKAIDNNLLFTTKSQFKEDEWKEEGWFLAIPFMTMLLLLFRKGMVIYMLLMLSSCQLEGSWKNLWFSPDYQAQQKEQKGLYKEAAQLYESNFHKGVAYSKAQMWAEALSAFEKDTSARATYNIGVIQYQLGNYQQAQDAFEQAYHQDSTLQLAKNNAAVIGNWLATVPEIDAVEEQQTANQDNVKNKDMEDLGGGGQEATEEDMKKERKEETVTTDMRTAKELEEVPDEMEKPTPSSQKVLMRKVNDDPALFLQRKFKLQQKGKNVPKTTPW